jgi:hypothetical protein
MSLTMKILSFLLRLFGIFLRMPAPLKENTTLKHISLVLSAHDDCIDGMKDLLRSINNYYRGKEYTILQTHFYAEDPINQAIKGLSGFSVNAETYVFTKDIEVSRNIKSDPGMVHFEWPMFI